MKFLLRPWYFIRGAYHLFLCGQCYSAMKEALSLPCEQWPKAAHNYSCPYAKKVLF